MATSARPRARASGSARRTNGHVAAPQTEPAASDGPQIDRRYEWVPIDETSYPGFRIKLWTNHPFQLYKDIYAGAPDTNARDVDAQIAALREKAERSTKALMQIAPEHNHWRNFDGREFAPADTAAFWDELPVELFRVILYAIDEAPNLLPKALRAARATSPSFSTRTSTPGGRPA